MINFNTKYILNEELGKGEFSIVNRCTHKQTQKEFAAKIIKSKHLTQRSIEKLKREVKICGQLNHPNIVHLFDTIQEDEGKNVIMIFELMLGGELFDSIIARKCYSESDSACFIEQLFEGTQYLHDKNIIHRDLKPENILLTKRGENNVQIKIADFGLAVIASSDDPEWYGFAGTPGYLSPEILSYQKYGKSVDLWSCGVILYVLLVGYPPFWNSDQSALYAQIKNGNYGYPSPEWDQIGLRLKKLIDSLLVVEPDKRFNSSQAIDYLVSTSNNKKSDLISEKWKESLLLKCVF